MDSVPNQDEASIQEDSSSEEEIDPEVIFNPPQAFKHVYVIYRGSQDGLDCEWWSLF